MTNGKRFLFVLAVTLTMALSAHHASSSENSLPRTSPETSEAGRDTTVKQHIMALEPFYLIWDHSDKVWIERVILSLKLGQPQKASIDLNHPHQRSRLFEILACEPVPDAIPAKVQAALNQALGMPAVTSVHVSRSFLLF